MDTRKMWVALVVIALSIAAPLAMSQAYPSKPVRLIVPYGAGGDTIIGTEAVAKASPDGQTILFSSAPSMTILPHTRKRLPYDTFKDFIHVAQIAYLEFAPRNWVFPEPETFSTDSLVGVMRIAYDWRMD